ncbi:MAG TPA: hypothetical protein VN734_02250 [Acidobacteriaceae bacterium]|nr:hypothetical protein [Acidobacteriaceae bacterium]
MMHPRLAHLLTRLYPRPWRARYADEFEALLLSLHGGPRLAADILLSAFAEHIHALRGVTMNPLSRRFAVILTAYLAVIAAGINLYATVDDTPLAPAMRLHIGMALAWYLIALGSLAALAGAAAMSAPLVIASVTSAFQRHRRDILARLLVGPLAACLLVAWVVGGFFILGGHWAPVPWDISGDWIPSAAWPPLHTRWIAGSITAFLAITLLIATSISLYQAIQRTPFDELRLTVRHRWLADPLRLAKLPALVTVTSICAMTLGVLAWGLLACIHVPSTLLSYLGPLHTTALASWLASAAVFVAASAITLRMSSALSGPPAT